MRNLLFQRLTLSLVFGLAVCLVPQANVQTATAPAGFFIETLVSGLNQPTTAAFAPDGRIFIAEKPGYIRIVKNGQLLSTPFLHLTDVNEIADHGVLGLALDPNFATNGFVYISYTFENTPGKNYNGPKTARIVRVKANGDVVEPGSYTILVGSVGGDEQKPTCWDYPKTADCMPSDSPSHSAGGLRFGPDGKLYATVGDGAGFFAVDPNALLALDIDSLAGKILRINTDGTAPADNPFYNGDPKANRSKVWAYGIRNSFRFNFRPSNNRLYAGDVGWYTEEEINVGKKGANYGWPCREGYNPTPEYNCTTENYTDPIYAFHHTDINTYAITGGAFSGNAYPEEFRDNYFFGIFGRSTIKRAIIDQNDVVTVVEDFLDNAGGPVDFFTGPDGSIYYLAIFKGELRRITYATNLKPTIVASATPTSGFIPLVVHFSAEGTTDPENDTMTYLWDFGDGTQSVDKNPDHTYVNSGNYTALLTVTDSAGSKATKYIGISATQKPTQDPVDPVKPSFVSAVIDPEMSIVGIQSTMTANIKNVGGTEPFIIDLELYDSAGVQIKQQVYDNVSIASGQTQPFTLQWLPEQAGKYRLTVGLFHKNWNGIYEWTDQALIITVLNRRPVGDPSGTVSLLVDKTTADPTESSIGTPTKVQTIIKNTGSAGEGLVNMEIHEGGNKVGQKFYDNVFFNAGEIKTFSFDWIPDHVGTFNAAVGLFSSGWAKLHQWVEDGANIAVKAAGGTADLAIYTDSLVNGWQNWSWETRVNTAATNVASVEGIKSLQATFSSPWAGLFLYHGPISMTEKTHLSFSITGASTGGQALQVMAYNAQGVSLPPVALSKYLPQAGLKKDMWQTVQIPLSDLGVAGEQISAIALQGNTGGVEASFNVDAITIK